MNRLEIGEDIKYFSHQIVDLLLVFVVGSNNNSIVISVDHNNIADHVLKSSLYPANPVAKENNLIEIVIIGINNCQVAVQLSLSHLITYYFRVDSQCSIGVIIPHCLVHAVLGEVVVIQEYL